MYSGCYEVWGKKFYISFFNKTGIRIISEKNQNYEKSEFLRNQTFRKPELKTRTHEIKKSEFFEIRMSEYQNF